MKDKMNGLIRTERLELAKVSLLKLLLGYCGRTTDLIKYIDNDFFHKMAAQLYITYINNNEGNLNDKQIKAVHKFVDNKWDGTREQAIKLLDGIK